MTDIEAKRRWEKASWHNYLAKDLMPMARKTFTTQGGSSSENFTITGIKAGMSPIAQTLSGNVHVTASRCVVDNEVQIDFSGDPSNTTTLQIVVFE